MIEVREIEDIRAGLPYRRFEELRRSLGVTTARLLPVLRLSERTLYRRKRAGRFSPEESDRLWRLWRLHQRAVEVLGEEAGPAWLTTPKAFLDHKSPLDLADTEAGALEVEALLGRIEHGVFG